MKQVQSIFVFLCIFGAVWGQSIIEISRRVMNGENAKLGQFPYHAIFMVNNKLHCGASIIHKRWVLTAAHCFVSDNVTLYTIVVGGIKDTGTDGKKYDVEMLARHENFSTKTLDNDIMLMRLKTDIKFNKNTSPVKLPADNVNQFENSSAILSGLGATNLLRQYPKTMQFAHVRLLPQAECRNVITGTKILDSHLCSYDENQKGSCVGDSGGPLVVNGTQVSLVSFGIGEDCSIKNPSIDTRISFFLPWIKRLLNKYNDVLPH